MLSRQECQDLGCGTLLLAFLLVARALLGKHVGLRLRHGGLSSSTVDMETIKKLVANEHLSGHGEVLRVLRV